MRRLSTIFMLVCALLIAAFAAFTPIAIACVAISATVILAGEWTGRRVIGIVGFFVLTFSIIQTADFPDLTVPFNIALVGILFVLPLSSLLWFSLTIGSYFDEEAKRRFAPYVWAVLFVAVVLASVTIAGIVLHSTRFSADIGIESQVMLIGFVTAILAVALLGADDRR